MGWTDNSDLTEPAEYDGTPKTGLVGKLFQGEHAVITFHSDGEEVERDHGTQVEFDATFEEATGRVENWEGERLEPETEVSFETGSNALLMKLAELDLVGNTFRIVRNYDGPASPEDYYTVEQLD